MIPWSVLTDHFTLSFIRPQGKLEEAIIVSGPNGYVLQCPHLDSHCPTCGQFRHLQNTIELLQQSLYDLKLRVSYGQVAMFISVVV